MIDFTWDDGKWHYTEIMDDIYLSIKDYTGMDYELVQLASWEAQKILGVWLVTGRE